MNFLYPELHVLFSDNNTTGYSAGEFPILYYLSAAIWKIVGVQESVPKIINVLLLFLGLFHLFRLCKDLFGGWWGVFIGLLFFTSPVLVYYSNSPMTDNPAFSLSLIGIYFFYRFYETQLYKYLYYFMALFLFACLLKVTAGIPFIVVLLLFIAEKTRLVSLKGGETVFKRPVLEVLLFLGVIAGVAGWYLYASHFNKIHGGYYSESAIDPIWKFNPEQRKAILEQFRETTCDQIFSPYTSFIFLFLGLTCIISIKKINRLFAFFFALMAAGTVIYLFLWFAQWRYDEYYMHPVVLCFALTTIAFFSLIKKMSPEILDSRILKTVCIAFLLYNIWYCSNNASMRFAIKGDNLTASKGERGFWWWLNSDYELRFESYETIEPYNRSIGINKEDLVISVPDPTCTASLYFMNQRGWTNYGWENDSLQHGIGMKEKIEKGAKYLFLSDTTFVNNPLLKQYTEYKIGQYKNIAVFDLRKYMKP